MIAVGRPRLTTTGWRRFVRRNPARRSRADTLEAEPAPSVIQPLRDAPRSIVCSRQQTIGLRMSGPDCPSSSSPARDPREVPRPGDVRRGLLPTCPRQANRAVYRRRSSRTQRTDRGGLPGNAPAAGRTRERIVQTQWSPAIGLLDATHLPCRGKGSDEPREPRILLHNLVHNLEPGDVLHGDAAFESYWSLAGAQAPGCDVLTCYQIILKQASVET